MKQSLFVLFCAICLIFTSLLISTTNASFNDVEHSNFVMKTCENFEQTDQNCQPSKWDRSHLELIDQTMIKGTVCAPQKLSMTLKIVDNLLHTLNGNGNYIKWKVSRSRYKMVIFSKRLYTVPSFSRNNDCHDR